MTEGLSPPRRSAKSLPLPQKGKVAPQRRMRFSLHALHNTEIYIAGNEKQWYNIPATQFNTDNRRECVLAIWQKRTLRRGILYDCQELCGSNRSCAFFGARLRLRTFLFTEDCLPPAPPRKKPSPSAEGEGGPLAVDEVLFCSFTDRFSSQPC